MSVSAPRIDRAATPLPSIDAPATFPTAIEIVAVAALLLGVGAGANRLPIMFPDTIGYNRAGEAIYQAAAHALGRRGPAPVAPADGAAAPPASTRWGVALDNDGVSTARSPYYGFALASLTRTGGVWLAATAQALIVATTLVFGVRWFGVPRRYRAGAILIATTVGGLGFFSGVLLPDVFLGPVVVALAILLTRASSLRGRKWFWIAVLVFGLLAHRGFLAVALAVVIAAIAFYRAPWFDRRGWWLSGAACLIGLAGHELIAPVSERLLHRPAVTQPFVLARMAEGTVVPAYLNEVCATQNFLMCRYRARLPINHDQFLWYPDPAGIYPGLTLAEKLRLNNEAGAIVAGAIAARPVEAVAEAVRLSVRQFLFVGMDDFYQHILPGHRIDPAMTEAMIAYPRSGIIAGDFPLNAISRITAATYFAGLALLVAAGVLWRRPDWFGRRRVAPVPSTTLAMILIVVGALAANAAISASLSGVRDRYQGRVAWLAILAAAAAMSTAASTTARPGAVRPTPRGQL